MRPILIASLCCLLVASCDSAQEESKIQPKGTPLSAKLQKRDTTEFVATLESPMPKNANVVYTPTLLFAWNEIKKKLPNVLIVPSSNSADLELLHQSKGFLNALKKGEYQVESRVGERSIYARALFNLHLTFSAALQKIGYHELFKNERVECVGMNEFNEAIASQIDILFYKDDEHFIFRINPEEPNNELIFIKGLAEVNSMKEVLAKTQDLIEKGKVEMKTELHKWEYSLTKEDDFYIPTMDFNEGRDFKDIMGQTIRAGKAEYRIDSAYQRTAFLLSEKGVTVESEAVIGVVAAKEDSPIEIKPKRLRLNNTYFIIAKHKNAENPYFVMKVDNKGLMKKRKSRN